VLLSQVGSHHADTNYRHSLAFSNLYGDVRGICIIGDQLQSNAAYI